MGVFRQSIEVASSGQGPYTSIEAIVDTDASFSQFPRSVLNQLGVQPLERRVFTLADGRSIARDLGEVVIRIDGRVRHTVCVIGDDGIPPLLGAQTLEAFGLTVDPVNQRLVEAPLYLL